MSNRKLFISYDDFKTETKIDKCGVSQGSIQGPLLFIFVNDINNSTIVLDPVLFADDTNLFCSNNNIRALFETANQRLSQINYWFLANKLSLNVGKIKSTLFHKFTDQENITLKLNGNIIERENYLKFLGVILDEHLTWKKPIKLIENKVSNNVVLYKTRKLINSKCLQSIYFSFVHSYISYANIAWASSTNKTELKKLFRKQKQSARIIFNQVRFTHAVHYLRL